MKKKFIGKRLILNKNTISNLTQDELKLLNGGQEPVTPSTTHNTSTSMAFSCDAYFTVCLLSACG